MHSTVKSLRARASKKHLRSLLKALLHEPGRIDRGQSKGGTGSFRTGNLADLEGSL